MPDKLKNIQLIAFDVDGTLFFDGMHVADKTKDAIKRIQNETDIILTLATGREYTSASQVAQQFDFEGPLVCNNGGVVRNETIVLSSTPLPDGLTEKLIHFGIQHHFILLLLTSNQTILYSYDSVLDEEFFEVRLQGRKNIAIVHSIEELYALTDSVNKVCLLACAYNGDRIAMKPRVTAARASLKKFIHENHLDNECDITTSLWNNLEIMPKGITKATGVLHLAKHYDISPDDIMVFGDNENDAAMLSHIKHSVAMGNASKEIQAIATYVTEEVEKGGVGLALERYILD